MMKICKQLFVVLLLTLLYSTTIIAETLTVDAGGTVAPGTTGVTVNINLNDTTRTAGAAFTVTYDKAMLTLTSADSSFFDMLSAPVFIDPDTYDQALVYNTDGTTEGVMIAGAKTENGGDAFATTILTLTFDVDVSASGNYLIDIVQSVITNIDAGYTADPLDENNKIPMLVGVDDSVSPTEYPAIPMVEMTIVSDNLTAGDGDTDSDGIPDQWERDHVPPGTAPADELDIFGFGDFDHDGYSDVVEYGKVLLGTIDGNGVAYSLTVVNLQGEADYDPATDKRILGDFNADGTSDVLAFNSSGGILNVWEAANSALAAAPTLLSGLSADWAMVGSGDFNGDGTSDVLMHNTAEQRLYIWNVTDSVISSTSLFLLGFDPVIWDIEGFGDFNGDGTSDILVRKKDQDRLYIWNVVDSAFDSSSLFLLGISDTVWNIEGIGDFNADGSSDILVRKIDQDRLYIWNVVDSVFSSAHLFLLGIGSIWDVEGIGDFNRDGTSDILMRKNDQDRLYIWNVSDSIFGSAHLFLLNIGAIWTVEGTKDYSGDATSDILVRKNDQDRLYVWDVNNSVWNKSTLFLLNVTSAWDVD